LCETECADNRERGVTMSKGTPPGIAGAELAEHYDRTHDVSQFDEAAAYPVEVRRSVTISVRFSEDEMAQLRRDAEAAGLKLTAFIRAAALQASSPVDRERLQAALRTVTEDVARAELLLRARSVGQERVREG
jgi:hypothetical protein